MVRKVHQRGRDAPGPESSWDEIVPGLWMGGHVRVEPGGSLRPVVVGGEFDLVVSLYSRAGHGPPPGVEHLVAEIPDRPLSAARIDAVRQAADTAARAVEAGRTVLVRCHYGYNRSGLVVAQALVLLGHDAPAAIRLVRRKRSPWALSNRTFQDYLTTGLDVAYLLAGLQD